MKRLALLLGLGILAVGIAANANIQSSNNTINESGNQQMLSTTSRNSIKQSPNPATIGLLFGIGIVSFVTFGRKR